MKTDLKQQNEQIRKKILRVIELLIQSQNGK